MTNETFDALEAALAAGTINESELMDLISRGNVRRKESILKRVSKALDEGATEADFVAVVEKSR